MSHRLSLHIDRPRRLPRTGVMVAAALVGMAIGAAWRLLGPGDVAVPAVPPAAAAAQPPATPRLLPAVSPLGMPTLPRAPAPRAGAQTHAPAAQAPLSVMVAPGVHVTPMSVPPGTVPEPAGPREHDSEPEN